MLSWIFEGLGTITLVGIIAFLSGAIGALVSQYYVPKWLQTHKAKIERELETYRMGLKRTELIFQRQVDAADALIALARRIEPTYGHPDMDHHDACEDVASRLGEIESQIAGFLDQHTIVLTERTRAIIEPLVFAAAEHKFSYDGHPDASPPEAAMDAAAKIMSSIAEASNFAIEDLMLGLDDRS